MASRFLRLFRLATREPKVGDDVDQEIATHLAQLTEWLVGQGWERAAAQEEAKRRIGDVDRFRRELATIDQSTVRRRQAIRRALLAERPDLPYVPVQSYQEILDRQSRQWDLGASLLTVFGGLSLAIAAIGLYGVMAFGISQRTREIGLRATLGAPPRRLRWGVIGGGIGIAALGVGLGTVVVLSAAGQLEGLLFRTRAADPLILGAAAVLVITVSFGAAWLPGRQARAQGARRKA